MWMKGVRRGGDGGMGLLLEGLEIFLRGMREERYWDWVISNATRFRQAPSWGKPESLQTLPI